MTAPIQDPTVSGWGRTYDVAEGPRHLIDETVKGGAFASVRLPAWHGLGVVVEHPIPALDLLQLAKADYPILRGPVTTTIEVPMTTPAGDPLYVPGYRDEAGERVQQTQQVTATDERNTNICRIHPESGALQILGQASKSYPLWTPREILVGFGDAITRLGEPEVATCGVLDDGRRAFMCFKLPRGVLVGGMRDETIQLWLVVHTSFDQSMPTTAVVTPLRAVCANTVRAGIAAALARYTIRKTKNADLQLKQAAAALELVPEFAKALQAKTDAMVETTMTDSAFLALVRDLWGPGEDPGKTAQTVWDAKESKLVELFTKADTQANVRNTAWGALQAVTEYVDWNTKAAGTNDAERNATRFRRSFIESEKTGANAKDAMLQRVLALSGV